MQSAPAVVYRTDDPTRWGTGLGRNLGASDFDQNTWELAKAIVALQNDRPQPNNIASVEVTIDGKLTITLDDGTQIGPLPLPVLEWRFRGAWLPYTVYAPLDGLIVEGFGLYTVMQLHTSAATFDENLQLASAPVYNKIMGSDAGAAAAAVIYDIGFYYPGRLSDCTNSFVFELIALRDFVIPAAGSQHKVFFTNAPSTALQSLPIFHNGSQFGHADVPIGQNSGTVTIDADETIPAGDRLVVGVAATADATAAGLAMSFAAQRVL